MSVRASPHDRLSETWVPFLLFLPQGNHRVDARGAARGNNTCQCRYPHKNQGYHRDGRDVVGTEAVEQLRHQAGRDRRQDEANGESGERQPRPRLPKESMMSLEVAPSAMRTPISLVRCATA